MARTAPRTVVGTFRLVIIINAKTLWEGTVMNFKDRADGGRQLVEKLSQYKNDKRAIVLGLPRGGVVTAFEVAKALGLDLDIIVTRKIGAPMQPELAVGALTQDGEPLLDQNLMETLNLTTADVEPIIKTERVELQRRLARYRGNRPPLDLKNRIALIVDDGIATGATMRAAIKSARARGAQKIVVAVPVCTSDSLKKINQEADEVICLLIPETFFGVGGFYEQFSQTEDEEVERLLQELRP